jgi:hypothetical protein
MITKAACKRVLKRCPTLVPGLKGGQEWRKGRICRVQDTWGGQGEGAGWQGGRAQGTSLYKEGALTQPGSMSRKASDVSRRERSGTF